ncbi:MAG: hypothetical protein AAFQ98_21190, partial [Bacteroidota bacterium]
SWVLDDLFLPNWKKFLGIVALEGISLGSQIGGYSLLFRYVSRIENSEAVTLLGRTFIPTESATLLAGVAIGTSLLFIVSSLFSYRARLAILSVCRQYEEHCSKRILRALQKLTTQVAHSGQAGTPQAWRRAMVKDSRFSGRGGVLIPQAIMNGGKLLLSLGFMLYVDLVLTLVILAIILPLALLQRRLGKRVISITQKREQVLPQFIAQKRQLMEQSINQEQAEDLDSWYTQGKIPKFYNLYYGQLRGLASNDLLTTLFIAIFALVVVLVAGNRVLFGDLTWAIFAAYMVALRFFFNSLQGLNGVIKRSSKIYSYMKHYRQTLQRIEKASALGTQPTDNPKEGTDFAFSLGLDLDDDDDDDDV